MKTLSRRRFLSVLPGIAPLLAMPRPAEDAPVVTNEELQEEVKDLREKQRKDIADVRKEQSAIQKGNYIVWGMFDDRLDVIEGCLLKCDAGDTKNNEPAKGEL